MFWNKKDKSTLPELPLMNPNIYPLQDNSKEEESSFETEKQPLPSFPDSPTNRGFSQSAIKNAVDVPEETEQESILNEPKIPPMHSLPMPSMSYTPSIVETYSTNTPKIKQETSGNVFVKIEKFNSARKALTSAQQKIDEIDKMLKKIREARMREEQELSTWEKEVENAKTRIEETSKNLFDKLS